MNVFKLAKGFRGRAKNCTRIAPQYSRRHYGDKRRDIPSLWIQRMQGVSYENFIKGLTKENTGLLSVFSFKNLFATLTSVTAVCTILGHFKTEGDMKKENRDSEMQEFGDLMNKLVTLGEEKKAIQNKILEKMVMLGEEQNEILNKILEKMVAADDIKNKSWFSRIFNGVV